MVEFRCRKSLEQEVITPFLWSTWTRPLSKLRRKAVEHGRQVERSEGIVSIFVIYSLHSVAETVLVQEEA